MSSALDAIKPGNSATVSASAGTGKTWLLVSRLIRLLLAGARPEGILAVTFTRKAAGEMQMRLTSRLLELAACSEQELDESLASIGAPVDDATRSRARTLYETLLASPVSIKTTTFHAFCQDILKRFPLEAGIPPGFELLESSTEFQQAAWDALCAEASRSPDSEHALAIQSLFETCGSLDNTRTALNGFLNHRSDWWAFTEDQTQPLEFAIDTLADQLDTSLEDDPEQAFFSDDTLTALAEFTSLLQKHQTATNLKFLDALSVARDPEQETSTRFPAVISAFLTKANEPLKRSHSKALAKSMGEDGVERFLEIHVQLCKAIFETREKFNKQLTLRRSTAWYQAGVNLLDHYQRLKAEQRVLDFADLEWQAYRLLNHGNNVHWIQYKLDQRIDHLLIDEFQDTNPTQWRLILPLLQELAAGEDERGRTVFLVGDDKQSIYRFRRADPELFDTAQHWLQNNLHAVSQPLDTSWRSAQAIITFVNHLFGSGPLHKQLSHFSAHQTHRKDLWGKIEILPLIEPAPKTEASVVTELRNPLKMPRELCIDQRHLEEGRMIAEQIIRLIEEKTPVNADDSARPIRYSDIMILIRNRTHTSDYEQALRAAGIPYLSANRGTLLESQEARDMIDLLNLLVTPYNNIALASLLRSPLFDCSHSDLIALGKLSNSHWIDRLQLVVEQRLPEEPLHRAHRLLSQWRKLVDTLPVHDLLDRIFCEGDVINRYQAGYPSHLQNRVTANLTRFIELALEVDSGRYPTIGHFIQRLTTLRQQEQDAPDEGTPTQTGARVRIMTVHGSKGLEAPVVFLADSANERPGTKAYRAVVDWPAQSARPDHLFLAGKKDELDTFTQDILERHASSEAREDANLFYVAVTRARQMLFMSGCRPSRSGSLGWYGIAESCLRDALPDEESLVITSGSKPEASTIIEVPAEPVEVLDPRLNQPIHADTSEASVSPSKTDEAAQGFSQATSLESDQQTRGIVIHRILELFCESETQETVLNHVASEFNLAADSEELATWYAEAEATFIHPQLAQLFDTQHFQQAFNEVPIYYRRDYQGEKRTVHGIIDRVIITQDEAWVIDYKTHPVAMQPDMISSLLDYYSNQIQLYCEGAARLWPEKKIRGALLFTNNQTLAMVDITPSKAG